MVRVLLVSTYELGRQPLALATAAAACEAAGHDVRCVDLAVDGWDPALADDAEALAVSVPMHTATRLADALVAEVRARRPDLPLAAFGLYAGLANGVDRRLAGEFAAPLVAWLAGDPDRTEVHLGREPSPVPSRAGLPGLDRYAALVHRGERRLAAAVETTRGCSSRCRHCPVPVVYDGRTRAVPVETLVADVDRLVDAGAEHLTVADPDFLSRPGHSVRALRAVRARHPRLTVDVTTKVELILRHRALWPELAGLGCLFVTTAVECVQDDVLAVLDKGHTAADAAEAVGVLRRAGIEPRPSLLPFTPWTTLDGLVDLVAFVVDHDLLPNVEPVHWSIRLLVPDGSLLLGRPELEPHLRGHDPAALGWRWAHPDPFLDDLQGRLAALVEAGGDSAAAANTILQAAGRPASVKPVGCVDDRPRLTEAWYCCAEPTGAQRAVVVGPRSR